MSFVVSALRMAAYTSTTNAASSSVSAFHLARAANPARIISKVILGLAHLSHMTHLRVRSYAIAALSETAI